MYLFVRPTLWCTRSGAQSYEEIVRLTNVSISIRKMETVQASDNFSFTKKAALIWAYRLLLLPCVFHSALLIGQKSS